MNRKDNEHPPSDHPPGEAAQSVQEAWNDFRSTLRGYLPEEFWEHERAARRELLLAVRSMLDVAIERLEEESEPEPKPAQKIEIE